MRRRDTQCPFCGGSPTTIERPDNIDGTQFFCAIACYCGRHSACAHKMAVRKTPEIAKADAIAAWNTRAPQPTQAQAGAVPLTPEQIDRLIQQADGLAPKEGNIFRTLVRLTEAEVRKQDDALIRQMLDALETCDSADGYNGPYQFHDDKAVEAAITAARARIVEKT